MNEDDKTAKNELMNIKIATLKMTKKSPNELMNDWRRQ